MNFEEYQREGYARYAAFVEAIQNILRAAVAVHSLKPYSITGRAKQPESLHQKLLDRMIDPKSAIDEKMKDLAGCRVVFLTNTQIDIFMNTRLLWENFEIIDANIHHPVPNTKTETKLFDSTNYLVRLKPDRLALPEYKAFEGLRAEIQVQTLLNHAWAEMGHDRIYKQPVLKRVGGKRLEAIQARMDKVMREYLLPAGHDFDKIDHDFDQLLRAVQSVDETIDTIDRSTDNNALFEAIGTLEDLILPHFDDRAGEFIELVPLLVKAVERTRGSESTPVETISGKFPGKTGEDIAEQISKVLATHRYIDPALTFATLVDLFCKAVSETEQKAWLDTADQLSAPDIDIWSQYGPAVQQILLDGIGKLSLEQRLKARSIILTVLRNLLSPQIDGRAGSSTGLTITRGAVPASKTVREFRFKAITILETMLDEVRDDSARKEVLGALHKGSTLPFNGGTDELTIMVMEDSGHITSIEKARVSEWELELRRWCEINVLHRHYQFRELPTEVLENSELVAAQQQVISKIISLRDVLNDDTEFVLYKTLIGYDSICPADWGEDPFNIQSATDWRNASFPVIIEQIDEYTIGEWIRRTRLYVVEHMQAPENLAPFRYFLVRLGEVKPNVACRFLEIMDESLAPMLTHLMTGISNGGERETVSRYIDRWIDEGLFLENIGEYLCQLEVLDLGTLIKTAERSIAVTCDAGVLSTLVTAVYHFHKIPDQKLIDYIFMKTISYLIDSGNLGWVNYVRAHSALILSLDEAQSWRLVEAFTEVRDLSYEKQEVLAVIANRFPRLILDLFEARVCLDRQSIDGHFDPIPFEFYMLQKPLSREPELILATAHRWFALQPAYHRFRGGRLVGNVFPKLLPEISIPLSKIVEKGTRDDLAFVLETLVAYEGAEEIYSLCMDIINHLQEGDDLIDRVSLILGEKRIVHGEFGFVEVARTECDLLEPWKKDPRDKVRSYVQDRFRRLEQLMALEQRQAEREIEMRRRDWGEA